MNGNMEAEAPLIESNNINNNNIINNINMNGEELIK